MTRSEELHTKYGVEYADPLDGTPVIPAPTLTFQYSPAGELASAGSSYCWFRFDANVQARFREFTREYWSDFEARNNFPTDYVWARLVEIVRSRIADPTLADNPFVLMEAWLLGLVEDAPGVAEYRRRLEKHAEQIRKKAAADTARRERKAEMESLIAVTVLRRHDDDALVRVTHRTTSESLNFNCRNIFDFGYVVSPDYKLRLDSKTAGGLANGDVWLDFSAGGWSPVRPMTELERLAVEYLSVFPPIDNAIRM